MTVKWLIIKVKAEDEDTSLEQALANQGIEYKVASFKDVYLDNIPYTAEDDVFVFAPILSTRQLTKQYGWLNWFPEDKIKCSNYYPMFDDHIIQSNFIFLPAKIILDYWHDCLYKVNATDYLFIRPDANNKRFVGDVFNYNEFKSLLNGIEPDVMCVVAEPVPIVKEWRVLMVNGIPITGSTYNFNDKNEKEEGMPPVEILEAMYATAILNKYESMPKMIHFDVGQTTSGRYGLVEISSVNSAGIYKQDPEKFVRAVQAQAELEYSQNSSLE